MEYNQNKAHVVMHKLMQTDRMHRSTIENFVSALGIHRSQHMLLMYLSKNANCPSQKEIADEFDISPAAVAVTLKKLEAAGFIERSAGQEDSRFNEIRLTQNGKDVTEKTTEMFSKVDYAMFSDFTEQELCDLEKSLDKIQRGLIALNPECTNRCFRDKP